MKYTMMIGFVIRVNFHSERDIKYLIVVVGYLSG